MRWMCLCAAGFRASRLRVQCQSGTVCGATSTSDRRVQHSEVMVRKPPGACKEIVCDISVRAPRALDEVQPKRSTVRLSYIAGQSVRGPRYVRVDA